MADFILRPDYDLLPAPINTMSLPPEAPPLDEVVFKTRLSVLLEKSLGAT